MPTSCSWPADRPEPYCQGTPPPPPAKAKWGQLCANHQNSGAPGLIWHPSFSPQLPLPMCLGRVHAMPSLIPEATKEIPLLSTWEISQLRSWPSLVPREVGHEGVHCLDPPDLCRRHKDHSGSTEAPGSRCLGSPQSKTTLPRSGTLCPSCSLLPTFRAQLSRAFWKTPPRGPE